MEGLIEGLDGVARWSGLMEGSMEGLDGEVRAHRAETTEMNDRDPRGCTVAQRREHEELHGTLS